MNRRRGVIGGLVAALLLVVLAVSPQLQAAGKGNGNGKGNGKPVAAVETVPDTTPEETWPPTTTIPFEPGTEITGDLTQAPSVLQWGGEAVFDASYEGTLSNRGQLYVTVACKQVYGGEQSVDGNGVDDLADGLPDVEYQWSQFVADGSSPGFGSSHLVFPLVDQAGDNLDVATDQPGDCQAWLIYRIMNDKIHTINNMVKLSFTVGPA